MQSAMISEQGNREINEDFVGKIEDTVHGTGCFVLCDGLGGHGHGEVASRLVVESICGTYSAGGQREDFLQSAVCEGQNKLLALQKEWHEQSEMKTTVVLLKVGEREMQWCHVGDSRLYYFEKNKLRQRTLDHSVPQMLVSAGEIKEKEIRHHPDRNRLLRVMGMEWDSPKYALSEPVPKADRQAFLLCSDGFWELIDEKAMQKCLKKAKTPEEWLALMRGIVLKNGKNTDMDNFSAIAVFV